MIPRKLCELSPQIRLEICGESLVVSQARPSPTKQSTENPEKFGESMHMDAESLVTYAIAITNR